MYRIVFMYSYIYIYMYIYIYICIYIYECKGLAPGSEGLNQPLEVDMMTAKARSIWNFGHWGGGRTRPNTSEHPGALGHRIILNVEIIKIIYKSILSGEIPSTS